MWKKGRGGLSVERNYLGSRVREQSEKIPRAEMAFFTPDSGFIVENKLAKGNYTSACHSPR
jgi:hypothetical protein